MQGYPNWFSAEGELEYDMSIILKMGPLNSIGGCKKILALIWECLFLQKKLLVFADFTKLSGEENNLFCNKLESFVIFPFKKIIKGKVIPAMLP